MGAFEDRQRESMLDTARSSYAYEPPWPWALDVDPAAVRPAAPRLFAAALLICTTAAVAIFALAA